MTLTPDHIAALRLRYATPKPGREDMLAALDEIERLRAGIQALIEGSPQWQPALHEQSRRLGKCIHDRWDYDGCDCCTDEYLQLLLDGEPK